MNWMPFGALSDSSVRGRRKDSRGRTARLAAVGVCLWSALAAGISRPALGQQDQPSVGDALRGAFRQLTGPAQTRLTDGTFVRSAFKSVVEPVREAVVRVKADGKEVAVGGVVGSDGYIVTKASDLQGEITVQWADGTSRDARIIGVDPEFDLAMIKVDQRDLPVLSIMVEVEVELGDWIATAGTGDQPIAVGVVSVGPRPIAKKPGILGVQLRDGEDGRPLVVQVMPESPAFDAGILVNDVIIAVNGKPTKTRPELIKSIRQFSPDEEVELTVDRGGAEVTVEATLTERLQEMPFDRGRYQNNLGGRLSRRRYGFPSVLQHDTVLRPEDCGGPLVNLEGRVVGFNLARGGRTESYAIPVADLMPRLFDLASGNLRPATDSEETEIDRSTEDDQGVGEDQAAQQDQGDSHD